MNSPRELINVWSPVTDMVYTMHCAAGASVIFNTGTTGHAVRCTGGNDAVLYFW
jgi:hypothetical protein